MPVAPRKQKQRNTLADRDYDKNRRKVSPHLALAKRIRSSKQWQVFREYFLNKFPLCCNPYDIHTGMIVEAVQVHHILECGTHPELALDEENCAGVCTRCHSTIEQNIRNGKVVKISWMEKMDHQKNLLH